MHENTASADRSECLELRCRFLVTITWIFGIGIIQYYITLVIAGSALFIVLLYAKPYRKHLLRNVFIIVPFLLVSFVTLLFSDGYPITKDSVDFAGLVVTRMIVCVWAVTFVTGNEVRDYLAAFQSMRFPNSLTSTLFLTQRYIHVVGRQFSASRNALVSRLFSPRLRLKTLKIYAQILGGMTLYAIDRSEHVRKAMESRGFQGKIRIGQAIPVRLRDVLESTLAVLPLIVILIAERWCFP